MTINEHVDILQKQIADCESRLEAEIGFDEAVSARDMWHISKRNLNYAKSVLARIPEKFSGVIRSIDFEAGATFFDGKANIFYVGTIGTGKTTQAYLVTAINAIRERLTFSMLRWGQFFTFTEKDAEDLARAMHVDILIIDDIASRDVSSEKMNEISGQKFDELIDYRYSHALRTIFTTNATTTEIKRRLSQPSVSRIFESCKIVEMTGEDRRKA